MTVEQAREIALGNYFALHRPLLSTQHWGARAIRLLLANNHYAFAELPYLSELAEAGAVYRTREGYWRTAPWILEVVRDRAITYAGH